MNSGLEWPLPSVQQEDFHSAMDYDDTHATPAQLTEVDADEFDIAVMKDGSAQPARQLFRRQMGIEQPAKKGSTRRLVVHVNDSRTPGLKELLLKTLKIAPSPSERHEGT